MRHWPYRVNGYTDDLVANVVADQLRGQAQRFRELQPGRAGLEEFLHEYLLPQHRDNPRRRVSCGPRMAAMLTYEALLSRMTMSVQTGASSSCSRDSSIGC